jgi:hypothetical protein
MTKRAKFYDGRPRPPCARNARRIPTADERVTSFHEAGHACIAVELKIRFTTIDIVKNDSDNGSGHIFYNNKECEKFRHLLQDGHHTEPRVVDWVHRKIIVSFAGAVAQRRYAPNSDWRRGMGRAGVSPEEWFAGARDGLDLANINSYLQRLVVGPPSYKERLRPEGIIPFGDDDDDERWYPPNRRLDHKALKPYHAEFEARAKALVRELWPQIQRVAGALLKKKVLSQAEVLRLMTEARPRLDLRPRPPSARYFQANDRRGDARAAQKRKSR